MKVKFGWNVETIWPYCILHRKRRLIFYDQTSFLHIYVESATMTSIQSPILDSTLFAPQFGQYLFPICIVSPHLLQTLYCTIFFALASVIESCGGDILFIIIVCSFETFFCINIEIKNNIQPKGQKSHEDV